MAKLKPCIRCNRPIDSYARSCVYCGWDQSTPPPIETTSSPPLPAYIPPSDNRLRNRLAALAAFALLVTLSLIVSSLARDSGGVKVAQTTQDQASPADSESKSRTAVTLVPVENTDSTQYSTPVTSAPALPPSASNVEINGDRTDATALPSGAYAAAAQRARTERDLRTNKGIVDPRMITGTVDQSPARRTPKPVEQPAPTETAPSARTEPIPLYQPVPSMQVDQLASARLTLTVGSEGLVHDINVDQSIPGEMPRLVAAVQTWRFKPATQNGNPVTSTFVVDITVHPR